MENKLKKLTLKGFKSIEHVDLELTQINVLIGANGSGKSNLIGFFRALSYMMSPPSGALQRFVGESGGASALLHDGPKRTREIEAELTVQSEKGTNDYAFRLFHAAGDALIFADEKCRYSQSGRPSNPHWVSFGAGHREAALLDRTESATKKTRVTIASLLRGFVVYHFHDTSKEARIKNFWDVLDNQYLKYDAANIAPFLLRLREHRPKHYRRIVETIRQIAPFFDSFVLEPNGAKVMLQWIEQGSDMVFSAHQASDGTLRAIALVTALMQPTETLPALLIIDEPELGLHPYAIAIIGGLIRAVGQTRQVLVATQSSLLLDQFEPSEVIVTERHGRKTDYRRLDEEKLAEWLEEYTLSDLWQRNILGGRPNGGTP